MTTFLNTNEFKVDRSYDFIDSFSAEKYYFFVGDYTLHTNTEVQNANNTLYSTYYDVFNKMIMGKEVAANSVSLGINNIPYEEDIVYTQYDDTIDLTDTNYYCVVNAESYYHVFKCLFNNHGANSTVTPNFMHIEGANTIIYQTSDGYIWKYMYTVDDQTVASFATSSYFPLVANTTVEESAVPGSINIIDVEGAGKLYNNYLSGTLLTADIRVNQNVYQITNSTISTITSYYTGCLMLLTSGDGVGQYETIADYYSNSSGNYVVLENDFPISPTNGTEYEITPQCLISTDGQTSNVCVARAIVNAYSSNSIAHIEILYPGSDHFVVSAQVIANDAVGVIASNRAVVRPILPPFGGHGANAAIELNAAHVLMSITLANSESNTILTSNKFQQVGLIKNPAFANVELDLTGLTQVFDNGETLYDTVLIQLGNSAIVNTVSNTVTDNTALFDTTVSVGDSVCISNGTVYQMATVSTITDNNTLTISTNSTFDTETGVVYLAPISETMVILSSVGDIVNISNSIGYVNVGHTVIGANSGAMATVEVITRNGVIKGFQTFVQLYKYDIVLVHGDFIPGETIVQGDETALLHSVVDTTMYLSGLSGLFTNTGVNIYGETSGAEAQITLAYEPELEVGKGTIQYIDNIEPKTRQDDQTETFKVVFDF